MPHGIPLTIGLSSYDHTRAITTGEVPIAGVDPTFVELPVAEMFRRFELYGEWEVSEIGLGGFAAVTASGDDRMVALPVFTSRLFRHSAIYVRRDRVADVEQLAGTRLGIPAWTNTAGIYARGMLRDMYGTDPASISWYQGGVDRPRRPAIPPATLPTGVEVTPVTERSLVEMLWSGELDGLIAPTVPPGILGSVDGDGLIVRLFGNDGRAEHAYYERTNIFPIMHMMAVQRRTLEEHPWLATNIYRAFEIAKRRCFARMEEVVSSRLPVPLMRTYLADARSRFGEDCWPYGVAANHATLSGFFRYANEQGVTPTLLDPNHVFAEVETFVEGTS